MRWLLIGWLGVLILLGGCDEAADDDLTPSDVAWAAGLKIWKYTIDDPRPYTNATLVVVGPDGEERISNYHNFVEGEPAKIIVSFDGNVLRFAAGVGSSLGKRDADLPKFNLFLGRPVRFGEMIYLAADGGTISPGSSRHPPFQANARKLAVKLLTPDRMPEWYREVREWERQNR